MLAEILISCSLRKPFALKLYRSNPKREAPARASLSRRRLWLFRFCAVTLIPLLLFATVELALRLFDYGYPTSFFLRSRIGDRDYYVVNERFGFRFFPQVIARTPFPLRMAAEKPANTYRIFLFGESAAQGDPDPTFGMGRYLEVLLRDRYPGTDFEVVCVAMTAINSHAILPIARECAGRDGDLWIVYMGNNEVVGPFGAGTVFGPQAPGRWLIRANLAAKATRTGQCIDALIHGAGREAVGKSWGGMKMFQDHQLRRDDPKRLRTRENFAANLEDILRTAHSAGVPVVLSTVASNLKDCAPFASMHRADLSADGKAAWEESYAAGVKAAESDPRAALQAFSRAAELDPEFAEVSFRMGTCWLALSDTNAAKRSFEEARDDDALGFRADTAINQIIRRAGEQHIGKGVWLVDAVAVAATNSPGGIAGEEFFYEHVHLNFDGNYLLARMFADTVAGRLPTTIQARAKTAWASGEECERCLAVSGWDRYRVWQANFSRVSEPPFTAQLNDAARARRYMARLDQLRSQLGPDGQAQGRALYEDAVKAAPDDPSLRGNCAQFLGEIGSVADAVEQQRRVCELLPQSSAAFYKLGLLLVRKGDVDAAQEQYLQALKLRDDYAPALNELGLIAAHRQKSAAARDYFATAIRINRGYAETYLNLGFLEQQEGNLAAAVTNYQSAAELQPGGPAAYFSQAVGCVADHRRADAVRLFQAAVWMNPGFWQARYLLGVELALSEKVEEAGEQFSAVVRLRPDFAKAHVNLGVALAKRRKLDEALAEFRTALQLNPTNELARRSVEAIGAMQDRK